MSDADIVIFVEYSLGSFSIGFVLAKLVVTFKKLYDYL